MTLIKKERDVKAVELLEAAQAAWSHKRMQRLDPPEPKLRDFIHHHQTNKIEELCLLCWG